MLDCSELLSKITYNCINGITYALILKKVFDGRQNNNYLIISLSEMYYLNVSDIMYRLQNVKISVVSVLDLF